MSKSGPKRDLRGGPANRLGALNCVRGLKNRSFEVCKKRSKRGPKKGPFWDLRGAEERNFGAPEGSHKNADFGGR